MSVASLGWELTTQLGKCEIILSDSSCDFQTLSQVALGVNLCDIRLGVTENHLCRLQAKLTTDFRSGCVA